MMALIENYSLTEIIIFIILLAIAIKSAVTFWDWLISRLSAHFKKENEQVLYKENTDKRLDEIDKKINSLSSKNIEHSSQHDEELKLLQEILKELNNHK